MQAAPGPRPPTAVQEPRQRAAPGRQDPLTCVHIRESCHKLEVFLHQRGLVNHGGPLRRDKRHLAFGLVYASPDGS